MMAHRRANNTDYFDILSTTHPDIRATATRDIEAAELAMKEKEKPNKKKVRRNRTGASASKARAPPAARPTRRRTRTTSGRVDDGRKKLVESKADVRSPVPSASKGREEKHM